MYLPCTRITFSTALSLARQSGCFSSPDGRTEQGAHLTVDGFELLFLKPLEVRLKFRRADRIADRSRAAAQLSGDSFGVPAQQHKPRDHLPLPRVAVVHGPSLQWTASLRIHAFVSFLVVDKPQHS